jgi:superfamily II DNA or RNA helicase
MDFTSINLEELREKYPKYTYREPFPHQTESFSALTKIFSLPATQFKGGLLVLPTGAGKTFTAVNWLYNHVIPKTLEFCGSLNHPIY